MRIADGQAGALTEAEKSAFAEAHFRTVEKFDPNDDRSWVELTEWERDFHLHVTDDLLVHLCLIYAARRSEHTGDNQINGRSQMSEYLNFDEDEFTARIDHRPYLNAV